MREPMTKEEAAQKTILVFVGRGKSTLSSHIANSINYFGVESVLENEYKIKDESENEQVILHLASESDLERLGEGLQRRSILFKIDF